MQLVDSARLWYKKASTWLAGTLGSAVMAYALLPERVQDAFPEWALAVVGALIVFLVPAAVQIKQPGLHNR